MINRDEILSAEYFSGLEKLAGCVPISTLAKNGVPFARLAANPYTHPFRTEMWVNRATLKARVLMTGGAVIFRNRDGEEQIRQFGTDENGFPAVLDKEVQLVNTHGMTPEEKAKHPLGVDLENPRTSEIRLNVFVVLKPETHTITVKPNTLNGEPQNEAQEHGASLRGLYSGASLEICGDSCYPGGEITIGSLIFSDAVVHVAECTAAEKTAEDAAQEDEWEKMTTDQMISENITATGLFFDGYEAMSLGVYEPADTEEEAEE